MRKMRKMREGKKMKKRRKLAGVSGVIGIIRACAVTCNKSQVTNDNPNLCPSVQFV